MHLRINNITNLILYAIRYNFKKRSTFFCCLKVGVFHFLGLGITLSCVVCLTAYSSGFIDEPFSSYYV